MLMEGELGIVGLCLGSDVCMVSRNRFNQKYLLPLVAIFEQYLLSEGQELTIEAESLPVNIQPEPQIMSVFQKSQSPPERQKLLSIISVVCGLKLSMTHLSKLTDD